MHLSTKSFLQSSLLLSIVSIAAAGCMAGAIGPDGSGPDGSVGTGGTGGPNGSGGTNSTIPGITPEEMNTPATASCADGIRDDDEACDDFNLMSGDGCGGNCRYIEPGFVCPEEGMPCRPFTKCGDGAVNLPEQCDDANVTAGDGCSPTCKFEIGYTCEAVPGPSSTCRATVCGDGVQEGSETCEEANGEPFDGCSTSCQSEPTCTDMGCTSKCGDGLIIGTEQCDDGNGIPGDGCSDTCQQEAGYMCMQAAPCSGTTCTLELPILYRDFNVDHPDFYPPYMEGDNDGHAPGVVMDRLNADGKPVWASSPPTSHITSGATFAEWYTNNAANALIVSDIMLYANGLGGYVNRIGPNGEKYIGEMGEYDGNPLFFPIDPPTPGIKEDARGAAKVPAQIYEGLGWPWENPADVNDQGVPGPNQPLHNFHFTSEIAYWFKYTAGMTADFSFVGDDDVWVFLNRRLLIDLGGIHVPLSGTFSIAAGGNVTWQTMTPLDPGVGGSVDEEIDSGTTTLADLGVTDGGVYEIKMFHAERKPEGSSFQITLTGFNNARSECIPVCGDGVIASGEQCDDGTAENTGGHNRCNPDCTLGEYCGDGIVQPEAEKCDDADPAAPAECAGCDILIVK
jgi:fibro-slime domain-containing protein